MNGILASRGRDADGADGRALVGRGKKRRAEVVGAAVRLASGRW